MRSVRDVLIPDVTGVRVFTPDRCANCQRWVPDELPGLFCSSWCKETCKHVRYFRGVFGDGRIRKDDVQAAVRKRLAFLQIGGYTSLHRELPAGVRAAVIERDGGRCVACGRPGTDIDHISGPSPDLSNLQLLCTDCHNDKTDLALQPVSPATTQLFDDFLDHRVAPEEPLLLADDEQQWANVWRPLKEDRKQRLLDQLADLDVDVTGITDRAELVLIRDDVITDGGHEEGENGYGPDSYFARAMSRDN